MLHIFASTATLFYFLHRRISCLPPSSSVFVYSMLFPCCLFCLVTDKKLSLICIKSISLRQLPAACCLSLAQPAFQSAPIFSCLLPLAAGDIKMQILLWALKRLTEEKGKELSIQLSCLGDCPHM